MTGKCGDAGSANPTNTSCFTCFTGDMCTERIPDCLVVETCGWPLMMAEIWGRFPWYGEDRFSWSEWVL